MKVERYPAPIHKAAEYFLRCLFTDIGIICVPNSDNNNLRDYYYRDITLGTDSQSEQLYEPTHNAEIALAFRKAGGDIAS